MLLYRHQQGHYLAVPHALGFEPACGYQLCYPGQDVPDIICRAFVQESGGSVLKEQDTIVMTQSRREGVPQNRARTGSKPVASAAAVALSRAA